MIDCSYVFLVKKLEIDFTHREEKNRGLCKLKG